jgi:hypothetical protein
MVLHGFSGKSSPAIVFIALQALDLASTTAFLHMGVQEANPLVRLSISAFMGPVPGLLIVKSLAALLGLACYRMNRIDLLHRANIFFSALVVWNIIAILDATLVR